MTSIGETAFGNCENLTIFGIAGSYAETYANENNIPFRAIGQAEPGTVSGDLNGDSAVNLKDVVLLRRLIAGGWNVTL